MSKYGSSSVLLVLFLALSISEGKEPTLESSATSLIPKEVPVATPYLEEGMDQSFRIVRPTVFVYVREPARFGSGELLDEVESLIKVVNEDRSSEFRYSSDHLDPWTENIVLIEEKDYWTVVFHLRGNANVIREDHGIYRNQGGFRPERIYYVRKSNFQLIEDPPEGSIAFAPDYFATITIQIPVDYPGENVGSFMNHTEAARRTVETLSRKERE